MVDILEEDFEWIHDGLSERERQALADSTVLLTGCAGFLGQVIMGFLRRYRRKLQIRQIIGVDNRMLARAGVTTEGMLDRRRFAPGDGVSIHERDILNESLDSVPGAGSADYVLHMASVASPVFYRRFPLETLDVNVWGLRSLLDYYQDRSVRSVVYFSTSEIYGDPPDGEIPTPETCRGQVPTMGPRSCYDESKRFGETICYYYHQEAGMPLVVVRPFNTFGPGMSLHDGRVHGDFARALSRGRPLVMHSDGTPTRTYCYVSDAVIGYLKAMLHGRFDVFNIGMDQPEISVSDLAQRYRAIGRRLWGVDCPVVHEPSADGEYLIHNPSRRCPDLSRARTMLDYRPRVSLDEGIKRYLQFVRGTMDSEEVCR